MLFRRRGEPRAEPRQVPAAGQPAAAGGAAAGDAAARPARVRRAPWWRLWHSGEPEAPAPEPGAGGPPDPTPEVAAPVRAPAPRGAAGAPAEATAEALTRTATHAAWLRIREEIPAWQAWLLGALPILALLGLWWAVTAGAMPESRLISPTILPSPREVVGEIESLWFERALTRNLAISLARVAAGFAVAVAIAFPLGLAMGAFTKIKAMFNPLAVFGAYLPIPALVPLTLSLFGTGERQKVAFLALAFGIYLLPLIVAAVDQVDQVYLKTAYTLGANRWQAVTRVLLGVAWPDIFQALRLGFGIGWSYIILAEMVDIGKGVGGIINIAQRRGPREHIYLVLLVIVVLAYLTDKLWAWSGRRLFPYRVEERR
jgi:NitT/TauT family transport system permease protein